jgi:hypothetical protein
VDEIDVGDAMDVGVCPEVSAMGEAIKVVGAAMGVLSTLL